MEQQAKKKFYKKWWFWVLVIGFLIVVGSNNKPVDVAQNNTANKTASEEVFKVGDQVKIGDSLLTINKVEYSQGGQFSKPTEGNEWINLNITIENTASTQQYVTTLGQMFVRDGEKNSYQVTVTNKVMENPSIGLDGTIIANSKRTGWVGFEIPKNSKELQFQYNKNAFSGSNNILINLGR
ncbi:MAG: hypothetical protein QG614_490 [Patescibacteria group bacterium]|nr:hypothetical protein [Patescibacteria group bacterium]